MPLRPCLECGIPTAGTYCRAHDDEQARRAAKARANGLGTTYWRDLRVAALVRDGGQCVLHVDAGCTRRATSVHIRPELGGDHLAARLEDCKSACAHCHGVVDAPRARR